MFKICKNQKQIKRTKDDVHHVSFTHRELKISAAFGNDRGRNLHEVVIFAPEGFEFPDSLAFVLDRFSSIGEATVFADKIADAIQLGTIVLIDLDD
jgi:hypothetical protein|tara:strand:- start:365 stop:652 length:288 start_codon:yes stop_codon:yes gene_type:complete